MAKPLNINIGSVFTKAKSLLGSYVGNRINNISYSIVVCEPVTGFDGMYYICINIDEHCIAKISKTSYTHCIGTFDIVFDTKSEKKSILWTDVYDLENYICVSHGFDMPYFNLARIKQKLYLANLTRISDRYFMVDFYSEKGTKREKVDIIDIDDINHNWNKVGLSIYNIFEKSKDESEMKRYGDYKVQYDIVREYNR